MELIGTWPPIQLYLRASGYSHRPVLIFLQCPYVHKCEPRGDAEVLIFMEPDLLNSGLEMDPRLPQFHPGEGKNIAQKQ